MYRQQDPYAYQPHRQPTDFGSLSYGTVLPQKFGLPVEEMAASAQVMYERGEETKHAAKELALSTKLLQQKVRDMDKHHVVDRMHQIEGIINQYTEDRNWHNHTAAHLVSDLFTEIYSDPHIASAMQSKERMMGNIEAISAMEGYSEQVKQQFIAIATSPMFNRPIEDGGYIGYTPNPFVDAKEILQEYMDKAKFDELVTEDYDFSTLGQQAKIFGEFEKKGGYQPDDYVNDALAILSQDKQYQAYLDTMYDLNTIDPSTGERVGVNSDLIQHQILSILPDINPETRKRYTDEEKQELARSNYEGRKRTIIANYNRNTGEEPSEAHVEEEIRNNLFRETSMYSDLFSLMGIYSHNIHHHRFKMMDDFVWEGRQSLVSPDARVDFRHGGARDYDYDPTQIRKELSRLNTTVKEYEKILDNLEGGGGARGDEDYAKIREATLNLERAKANRNYQQLLLDALYKTVSDDDIMSALRKYRPILLEGGYAYRLKGLGIEHEDVLEYIRDKDIPKIEEILRDAITHTRHNTGWFSGQDVTYADLDDNDKDKVDASVNTTLNSIFEAIDGKIDSDKIEWHKELVVITPHDTESAKKLETFKRDMKGGIGGYTTISGHSSTSDDFRKLIEGSDDMQVHYSMDMNDGDLLFFVTWMKDNETLHQDLIRGNQLPGVNSQLGIEFRHLAEHPRLDLYPVDRQNLIESGNLITMMYQPTYTSSVTLDEHLPSSSLQDRLSAMNLHTQTVDFNTMGEGDISTDDPIILHIRDQESGIDKAVKIGIRKTYSGYKFYADVGNGYTPSPISSVPAENIGTLMQQIGRYLQIIE